MIKCRLKITTSYKALNKVRSFTRNRTIFLSDCLIHSYAKIFRNTKISYTFKYDKNYDYNEVLRKLKRSL